MRILMVNKYFYLKGGSERSFFELKKILEQNGHEVVPFAMFDQQNDKNEYSSFFVDNIKNVSCT